MLKEFFLHRNLGVYVDQEFGTKAGFFNLNKWLKQQLKKYNVNFYDSCCPTASATPETVTTASALSLTTEISLVQSNTASTTVTATLPAGFQGQDKVIFASAIAGSAHFVVNPSVLIDNSGATKTSISFSAANQFVKLVYVNTAWLITVNGGATIS